MMKKMVDDYTKRIDHIFDIYQEFRAAVVKNEKDELERKLIDGLTASCLLLEDIVKDTTLDAQKPAEPIWEAFRILNEQKKLEEFFEIERKLLLKANVKKSTVDELVYATQQVVGYLIEHTPERDPEWRMRLDELKGKVCPAARKISEIHQRRLLFRSAAMAAGGSLMILLVANGVVPATIMLAGVPIAVFEVGKWIFVKGAEGALKTRGEAG